MAAPATPRPAPTSASVPPDIQETDVTYAVDNKVMALGILFCPFSTFEFFPGNKVLVLSKIVMPVLIGFFIPSDLEPK